jgi:TonB family protein
MKILPLVAIVFLFGTACAARLSPETLASLQAQAEAGDTETQLELGDRYRDGEGVEADPLEAARWYRLAMGQGVRQARIRLLCLEPVVAIRETDLLGADGRFPDDVPNAEDIPEGLRPQVLFEAKPLYPRAALREQIQGDVVMDIVILDDGSVGDLRVREPLSSEWGMDRRALCAASQWRFTPATTADGQPIASVAQLALSFRIF